MPNPQYTIPLRMTIPQLHDFFRTCTGVSTDTRQITEGCLFVALRGDKFDGNLYAKDALEKGAKYAIVDNQQIAVDNRYLLVDNSLEALQQLAAFHRRQLSIPVIGLTGSNGKTTTKELIAAVLSKNSEPTPPKVISTTISAYRLPSWPSTIATK